MLRQYGIARSDIAESLKGLFGLPNFKPSGKDAIIVAIELFDQGLDFADALHLALCDGESAFLTFDDRFAKRADRISATPPVQLV